MIKEQIKQTFIETNKANFWMVKAQHETSKKKTKSLKQFKDAMKQLMPELCPRRLCERMACVQNTSYCPRKLSERMDYVQTQASDSFFFISSLFLKIRICVHIINIA